MNAAEIAERIVDAFQRGNLDVEELERAIAHAITAAAGTKGAARVRDKTGSYAKIKADPKRYAAMLASQRKECKAYYANNLEAERARSREKHRRNREEDPDKERERLREKSRKAWAERRPYMVAASRRKGRNRLSPATREKRVVWLTAAAIAALPSNYPKHVKDDIAAAVVLRYFEGWINQDEVRAETKRQNTAYWKNRSDYHGQSMDAHQFDDGKSTLHDTVSRGLWTE